MFKRLALTAVIATSGICVGTIIKNTNYVSEYLTHRSIRNSINRYEFITKTEISNKIYEENAKYYFEQNAHELFSKEIFNKLVSGINSSLTDGTTIGKVYYCCDDRGEYIFAKLEDLYIYYPYDYCPRDHKPSKTKIKKYNGILKQDKNNLDHDTIIKNLQNQLAKYGLKVTISHGTNDDTFNYYSYNVTPYSNK